MDVSEAMHKVDAALRQCRPAIEVVGLTDDHHRLAPFVPKQIWTDLGDAVRAQEQPAVVSIPGDKWISLRLDGTGFSKAVRVLRRSGALESHGFSARFASIMQECCQALMKTVSGDFGYTQSDEMTILIPPASVVRGEQQPHNYNGRVMKLCSQSAAQVSALFNFRIQELLLNAGKPMDRTLLVKFDCRVGTFDSKEDAISLILWRAYDCGVNGVADAVYHSNIAGRKKVVQAPTPERLKWLLEHNLLPLPAHQAYGTLYAKAKRLFQGVDPRSGESKTCLRRRIEAFPGPVLIRYLDGTLFPKDDEWDAPAEISQDRRNL